MLSEAAVIVLSILLAFWTDAWWEGQQEAASARYYLELLARDLNQHVDQLEEYYYSSYSPERAYRHAGGCFLRRDLGEPGRCAGLESYAPILLLQGVLSLPARH